MGISARLRIIAEKVTPGRVMADIGTDHGYVPIYVLTHGICQRVLACDMSPGALDKARENAARQGLEGKITCRLSDGFKEISPGEIDCAVISGMGGILMTRILLESPEVVEKIEELVLSPHRDAQLVRDTVTGLGFGIISEEEIQDKKKSYVIIKAVRNSC